MQMSQKAQSLREGPQSKKNKKNKRGKSGLMDLISRNQIKQLILEDEDDVGSPASHPSHPHGIHSHMRSSQIIDNQPSHKIQSHQIKKGQSHAHMQYSPLITDNQASHKIKKGASFLIGHGQDVRGSSQSRIQLPQEAQKSDNINLSSNLSNSENSAKNRMKNEVAFQLNDNQINKDYSTEEVSSKSSLDSGHDSHDTIDVGEGHGHSHMVNQGGDQAQINAQAELQFNILMSKMLRHCPSRLVNQEVFKFGTDTITHKNYEADLSQTVEELKIVLEKSKCCENILIKEFEAKKHQNSILISSNIVFNFEKMQEHRQKMKELEVQTEQSINDQKKLQKWLENAIIQNEGKFACHHKSLVYERSSLGIFQYDTSLRKMIVWLTEWKFFDRFVIFLIVLGSICQALDSQVDYEKDTEKTRLTKKILDQILEYSSYMFIMEAFLKIVSQGLFAHKNAYLRDGWNIVDFIVVISSIFEIIVNYLENVNLPEVNYLRTLRVIRPLRSVKRIPSMRRLVTIMLRSLPELANTLVFMLFFFIVFGIVGVQTFHGVIYQRCRTSEFPINGLWKIDPNQTEFICNTDPRTANSCNEGTFCGSPVTYSQTNEETLDLMNDNPWSDEIIQYNTVNFNNIINAICAIFEALTLEGWSIQMFMLMDTNSTNSSIAIFFYLFLVVFGSYFVLNLILAVIMGSFTRFETQEYEQKMKLIEQSMLRQVGSFIALGDIPQKDSQKEQKQILSTTPLKTSIIIDEQGSANTIKSIQKPVLNFKLQPQPTHSQEEVQSKNDQNSPNGSDSAFSFSNKIQAIQSQTGTTIKKNQQPNQIEMDNLNEEGMSSTSQPPKNDTTNGQNSALIQKSQNTHGLIISSPQGKIMNSKKEDFSQQNEITQLNKFLDIKDQSKYLKRTTTTTQTTQDKPIDKSDLLDVKLSFKARNSERTNRNQNYQRNSNYSQNSILEISNEDDYSIDYEEKPKDNQQQAIQNNESPSIEFDNIMEGGDKVNDSFDEMTPTNNNQPDSFTQLAKLNSQPKSLGTKILASYSASPSMITSQTINSGKSPINQTKKDDPSWNSMFFLTQKKSAKKSRREKNRSVGGKIVHAFNGTMKMSSKRYSKSSIFSFFGHICSNKYFNIIILIAIAMNTITLSMDRYPIAVNRANRLEQINKISTWIFVGELAIKVLGLGIQTYVKDSMNQFDAIVVIISIIEIVLSNQQLREQSSEDEEKVTQEENMSLTIFRGFRLLRVFRLFSKWKTFHKMIIKIGETLKDIITFFFLLLIIVFVFSLLGVELFKNQVKVNRFNDIVNADDELGYSPRQNFDDFLNAFVSVFVCLIGEDWQLIMHDYVRASKSMVVTAYFIILMIIGNLFLMNLFLAILLKNFEDKKENKDEEKDADEKQKEEEDYLSINYLQKSMKLQFRRVFFKKVVQPAPQKPQRKSQDKSDDDQSQDGPINYSEQDINLQPKVDRSQDDNSKPNKSEHKDPTLNEQISAEIHFEGGGQSLSFGKQKSNLSSNKSHNDSNVSLNSDQKGKLSLSAKKGIAKSTINILQKKRRISKQQNMLIETGKVLKLTGRSLFIFAEDNPCRIALAKLVVHQFFELFIFFTVLLSAVLMMIDGPLQDPEHALKPIINSCNLVITIIFMAELVLKVIAMGFIMHKHSYMRDGWNVLDFVIVAFSIASLIVESNSDGSNNQSAKTLELFKMLRVLRSLRMISKSEGLKLSVLSLIYSMPGILNVAIVSLLFLILLGIFFLNLFKGKFHYCDLTDDINENIKLTQIVNKFDCINYGGTWKNSKINFDGIGESLTALFVMCTTEGWVVFMNQANDSMGIGIQPVRNANPVYQYVFIIYMIFGSLFITNLFIEVVINTFDQEKKAIDRNDRLTKFQKEWIQLQLKCYDVNPESKINTNFAIRTYSIKIVENKYFDPFIMAMILLNAVTLAMIWIGMSQQWLQYLEKFSDIFNYIFIVECALKLIAYQKVYFQNGWNKFDFTIVVFGIWGLLRQNASSQISILRILRVGRLLRLLKRAKRLYIIFNSFISTIPAFLNVGGLILVIVFITSVLGQRFFADVMISGSLDKYKNFQTPRNSLITLILVMTGEGWYEFMGSLSRQREVDFPCIVNPTYQDYALNDFNTVGCGKATSKPFFIIYVILVSLILVNLFIAVTLQGFNDVSSQDSCRITDMQIQLFIDVWKEIDPDGTGYIHISEAASVMRNLIEKKCDLFPASAKDLVYDPGLLQELIEHLQLKLYKKFQYYNFHDILISLSQMYLQQVANNELDEIFDEFKNVHLDAFEPEDLDDVIEKIDEIMKEQNVQLCRKLEKTLSNFKNNVLGKIDRFEGNIYNSSMIPIVIKIQQIFRDKRRARALLEAEEAKTKKYDRKNMQKRSKLEQYDLSGSDDDEESTDLQSYINKRDKIATKIKKKLDDIIHGTSQNCSENGPTLQEMINKQTDLKKIIKKKELELETHGRIIEIRNSRQEYAFFNRVKKKETLKDLLDINRQQEFNTSNNFSGVELQTIKLNNYARLEADEIKEAINTYIKQKKLETQESSDVQLQQQEQKVALNKSPQQNENNKMDSYIKIRAEEVDIQSFSNSVDSVIHDNTNLNEVKEAPTLAIKMHDLSSNEEIDLQDKNIFPQQTMKSVLKPFYNNNHYSRQNQNFQVNTFESNSFDYIQKSQRASNQYSNIQSLQIEDQIKGLFEQDKSKESQELIDSRRNPVTEDISPRAETNVDQIDSFSRAQVLSNQEQQLQTFDSQLNTDTQQMQQQSQQQDQQLSSQIGTHQRKPMASNNQPRKTRGQPSQPKKKSGQDSSTIINRGGVQ